MKKSFLIFFISISFFSQAFSQSGDSLLTRTGRKYFINQKQLSQNELKAIYSSCPEAMYEYQYGKTDLLMGVWLVCGGQAVSVFGNLVINKKQNNDYTAWFKYHSQNNIAGTFDNSKYQKQRQECAGIGAAISTLGLVCYLFAPGHFNKAVDIYNSRHKHTSSLPVQLNLLVNSDGLGVQMRF